MKDCSNCHGQGLVGQGDSPWLLEGAKETCKMCSGTGKFEDASPVNESADTPAPEETGTIPGTTADTAIESAVSEPEAPASDVEPAVEESAPEETPLG